MSPKPVTNTPRVQASLRDTHQTPKNKAFPAPADRNTPSFVTTKSVTRPQLPFSPVITMPSYAAPKPTPTRSRKNYARPLKLNWVERNVHAQSLLEALATKHDEATHTGHYVRRALAHLVLARNLATNKAYAQAMKRAHHELGRAFLFTEPKDVYEFDRTPIG